MGKSLKQVERRGWDALSCTDEKQRLVHVCIENVCWGCSKPLCHAFSMGGGAI